MTDGAHSPSADRHDALIDRAMEDIFAVGPRSDFDAHVMERMRSGVRHDRPVSWRRAWPAAAALGTAALLFAVWATNAPQPETRSDMNSTGVPTTSPARTTAGTPQEPRDAMPRVPESVAYGMDSGGPARRPRSDAVIRGGNTTDAVLPGLPPLSAPAAITLRSVDVPEMTLSHLTIDDVHVPALEIAPISEDPR